MILYSIVEKSSLSDVKFPKRFGAEAIVELCNWYGKSAIRKIRIPKNYRNAELDLMLRTRRTRQELEILHRSKVVRVNVPEVLFADADRCELIMEYVSGGLLKDFHEADKDSRLSVFKKLGLYIARLHLANIIHGDLTTKNVIIECSSIRLIDFGLSFISDRLEDRAEDLHLLKQALKSSDSIGRAESDFENMFQGYQRVTNEGMVESIRKQISKIEQRGRYARVD